MPIPHSFRPYPQPSSAALLFLLVIATLTATASSQCSNPWLTLGSGMGGSSVPGTRVPALVATANGEFVAGGMFTTAGGVGVNHVARWNGAGWSPLGSGMSGPLPFAGTVIALTTLPNGDVVAGGFFSAAGGVGANRIARWNGTSWSPLGVNVSGHR